MFARTLRLTLRPGWLEDAPDLARAIAHESVCRNLARAPWPYGPAEAEAFLSSPLQLHAPRLLILAHEDGVRPRLVGGISYWPLETGGHEFGYWITPDAWNRGYATEAGHAVIRMARAMRVRRLSAGHFADNPASGRVLRKLGFQHTGQIVPRHSIARGEDVASVEYALDLGENCLRPTGPRVAVAA